MQRMMPYRVTASPGTQEPTRLLFRSLFGGCMVRASEEFTRQGFFGFCNSGHEALQAPRLNPVNAQLHQEAQSNVRGMRR